jgi:hypothetical protein
MAALEYKDQSTSALRLNLVRGDVNKEELMVLCTGKLETSYGVLEAGIIGASHYLQLFLPSGEVAFTEVFACTELKSENLTFYGDMQDASSIRKCFGNILYEFRAKKMTGDQGKDELFELVRSVETVSSDQQIGLAFVFPRREQDIFAPMTLVYVRLNPNALNVDVKTLHAYPNENMLAFTETKVSLK